jgi:mannose-6-phosphate isomerase
VPFVTVVTGTNPRQPALVVCGPPASGKSTLGRALAARLGAALLDQDVLTSPLTAVVASLLGADDLDSPALAGATRAARYETLIAGAQDNLSIGRPVVLVAPFTSERQDPAAWEQLVQRLQRAGGNVTLIWLRVDGAPLTARMLARSADRDEAKLADGATFLERTHLGPPLVAHIAVDATAGVHEQCDRVLREISTSRSPIDLPANQPADRFYLGGERIAAFRRIAPASDHVPEDWIASTTTVAGFDDVGLTHLADGRTLRAAIASDPLGWLGPEHANRYGADPALLVKLLDAGERLPVHVHPDDEFARQHLSCRNGKTESWIVLAAEPGARMYLGFNQDVDPARLASWVAKQDRDAMLSVLHGFEVRSGDTVYVPAGLPHAIGAGILLLELQQPADLSLLLEYSGFAIDGARDGHLGIGFDQALTCVRHDAVSPVELDRLRGSWDDEHIFPAVADDFFRADRIAGDVDTGLEPGFSVLVVAAGSGQLTWAGPDTTRPDTTGLDLRAGATIVVPYGAGPVQVRGELELLRCRPPSATTAGSP